MKKCRRHHAMPMIFLFLGLTMPVKVTAAVLENMMIGDPRALSLAGAVTADPEGVFSIHFNPAGLAKLKKNTYSANLVLAHFEFRTDIYGHTPELDEFLNEQGWTDPSANTTSETSTVGMLLPGDDKVREFPLPVPVLPTAGWAWYLEDYDAVFATALYSPWGAGYMREDDDPGRYDGKEFTALRLTYFAPTLGLEINEHWSVGIGVNFSWMGIGASTSLRAPNLIVAGIQQIQEELCPTPQAQNFLDICGGTFGPYVSLLTLDLAAQTYFSPSVNVGVLWEPLPWFAWGANYISEAPIKAKGPAKFSYSAEYQEFFGALAASSGGAFLGGALPLPAGISSDESDVTINLTSPSQFMTGIKVIVFPDWKVNLDLKYADWGKWDKVKLVFDDDIDALGAVQIISPRNAPNRRTLILPRGYVSNWTWALGVEHQYNDIVSLRVGYEPRTSSIPDDKQDLLVPLPDTKLYTLGAGFKIHQELPFLPFTRNSTVNVALGYMSGNEYVPAGSSSNANATDIGNFIYNPYAGTNFRNSLAMYLFEIGVEAGF